MDLCRFNRYGQAAVLAMTVLLAGCRTVQIEESAGGPWTPIPPGSTLTLNRPLQVPLDQARVFLRDGQVSPAGANQGPGCALEVRALSRNAPQTITPQTFRVSRVQVYWAEVAHLVRPGSVRLQLAEVGGNGGGGSPMIQEGYHLWLSGKDTNVMRLTCLGMLDEMWRSRPITLDEIRHALGDVATLRFAAAR